MKTRPLKATRALSPAVADLILVRPKSGTASYPGQNQRRKRNCKQI